jgi:hypothetical protein
VVSECRDTGYCDVEPRKRQLKVGGRMVLRVGRFDQELEVITRSPVGFSEGSLIPVRFVPMTGKAEACLRTESDGAGTYADQQGIQLPAPTRAFHARSERGAATTLVVVAGEPVDAAPGVEGRRPSGTARRNISPETAVPVAAALAGESSVGRAGQTTAPPLGVVTRALQRAGVSFAGAIGGGAQRRVCVCPGLRVCHGAIPR